MLAFGSALYTAGARNGDPSTAVPRVQVPQLADENSTISTCYRRGHRSCALVQEKRIPWNTNKQTQNGCLLSARAACSSVFAFTPLPRIYLLPCTKGGPRAPGLAPLTMQTVAQVPARRAAARCFVTLGPRYNGVSRAAREASCAAGLGAGSYAGFFLRGAKVERTSGRWRRTQRAHRRQQQDGVPAASSDGSAR